MCVYVCVLLWGGVGWGGGVDFVRVKVCVSASFMDNISVSNTNHR